MNEEKPILHILADCYGVYEIVIRALPVERHDCVHAEQLSAAIRPAIAIINKAIEDIYAKVNNPLLRSWKDFPESREEESNHG